MIGVPQKLYYEDCGVHGGRTIFQYNMEFILTEGHSIYDFLGRLVIDGQQFYKGNALYPFKRMGIILILREGGMIFAFTNEDDFEKRSFSYINITEKDGGNDPGTIRSWLASRNIQAYDILEQMSECDYS